LIYDFFSIRFYRISGDVFHVGNFFFYLLKIKIRIMSRNDPNKRGVQQTKEGSLDRLNDIQLALRDIRQERQGQQQELQGQQLQTIQPGQRQDETVSLSTTDTEPYTDSDTSPQSINPRNQRGFFPSFGSTSSTSIGNRQGENYLYPGPTSSTARFFGERYPDMSSLIPDYFGTTSSTSSANDLDPPNTVDRNNVEPLRGYTVTNNTSIGGDVPPQRNVEGKKRGRQQRGRQQRERQQGEPPKKRRKDEKKGTDL
jgi:hypothetical protein